jgi:uncharacterized protein YjiS (DUF1127 family)
MRRWRNWHSNRTGVAELNNLTSEEVRQAAHDVGVTAPELRVLAGRWPDSADLLSRRMTALGLDEAELTRTQPGVANDLNRLCSLCASKRRCANDLAEHPDDRVWEQYCPNHLTLGSLREERGWPAKHNGKR